MAALIGALRVALGLDTATFTEGLEGARSKLAGFASIAKTGVLAAGAAVAAGGAILANGVRSAINAADDMNKAAAKIGVPTETLSRLAYAAKLSDVSFDGLQTAVGTLSKNMAKFGEGQEGAVAAFERLGVSATNASGELRPTEDVIAEVADAMAAMPDGAEKTAAAMAIFGKAGRDMIPLLNGGSAALADMMAEADTFGQVFTSEMGGQAEAFNDNLTRLSGAFGTLSADLAQRLLPYLVQFSEWLVANGPAIADFVGDVVATGASFVQLGVDVATFVVDGVRAIQAFATDAVAALAALPGQLAQAGRDAIDGLLAGLRERWEAVKAWFGGLADAIPAWVRDPLGIQSPSRVFAEIGRNIMQGLTGGLDETKDGVAQSVSSFAQDVAGTFEAILTKATTVEDGVRSLLGSTLSRVGGSLLDRGIGLALGGLGIPGFARGTDFAPGGLALVGEAGPELVDLPRGARVTPNERLRRMGGASVTINQTVNAPNADAAGLAAVRAELMRMRAELPDTILRTIDDPRYRGAL